MVHKCTAQIQLTNRILLEVQSFERGLVQLLCIKKRSVSMQFTYHSLLKIIHKNTQHCIQIHNRQLSSILCSFNLTQVVSQPTHVAANGGASLIDLVILSNPQQLHECSVIPDLPHSDHNGISVTMNWKTA